MSLSHFLSLILNSLSLSLQDSHFHFSCRRFSNSITALVSSWHVNNPLHITLLSFLPLPLPTSLPTYTYPLFPTLLLLPSHHLYSSVKSSSSYCFARRNWKPTPLGIIVNFYSFLPAPRRRKNPPRVPSFTHQ